MSIAGGQREREATTESSMFHARRILTRPRTRIVRPHETANVNTAPVEAVGADKTRGSVVAVGEIVCFAAGPRVFGGHGGGAVLNRCSRPGRR